MSRIAAIAKHAFRFFASSGLAVVLLLLLMLLTFLGTIQQVDHGLYEVQKRYFGSIFVLHRFLGVIPVPLPGAYLLLALASLNVLCGGIVRARKGWRQIGVLIGHAGILALLVGGYLTFRYSISGIVSLYEGETADAFLSNDSWELAITGPSQNGRAIQHVIPADDFRTARTGDAKTFFSASIPFEVTVEEFLPNAQQAAENAPLISIPISKEPSENIPGMYVTVKDKTSGSTQQGTLWGMAGSPMNVTSAETVWRLRLQRRAWPLPFKIRLNKFTRELHPGTNIPSVFRSDLTRIEGTSEQDVQILMNEPLRYRGYALYQASWGPANAGPHDRLFSTLAVVRNPADKIPLYASCVICFGLFVHFTMKLFAYLKAQHKART